MFNRLRHILILVFTVSVVCSVVALIMGAGVFGGAVTIPALVISAWQFGGHLVTLDDDYPGNWSNPDGSKEVWMHSLRQLAIKFFVLLGVTWLYFLHK
jgi:hypothetical protein